MRLSRFGRFGAVMAASVLLIDCGTRAVDPVAIRLVDQFDSAVVIGSGPAPETPPPPTEWRFDGAGTIPAPEGAGETLGWEAFDGIEGLRVRDGHLVGTSAADLPLLHVLAPDTLDQNDQLHAIEIRMRVSDGTNLGLMFRAEEEMDHDSIVEYFESGLAPIQTALVPGDDVQTYSLTEADSTFEPSFRFSAIRHVLIRPTDVEDAEFEIESVRLISRREHMASIASGIGWQGLGDVFRETIVTRTPETIRMAVDLPSRPWLDLTLGTIEDGPVTFRVAVAEGDGTAGTETGETLLFERTVSSPNRWESTPVDLGEFANRRVTLSFTLAAETANRIGYWGAPVVRNTDGLPSPSEASEARAALTDARAPQGVILIVADTLRRDHLAPYGYERPTAPVVAQLAAEGTLFVDTISQGSWTKVAVPSILTSLYASTHGIVDLADRLPSSVTTLEEVYNAAGYATFHTSSVPFTGKLTNLHQGVEVLHERASIRDFEDHGSKTARVFVDRLLPWLEAHRDVPFFVFLHVFDPHSPFEPYTPYDTLWADASAKTEHEARVEQLKPFIDNLFMRRQGLPNTDELTEAGVDPSAFVDREVDWYDASIRAMDVEIGRLMERLRGLGLADKTLVAFTADHGEELLEHGQHWHGNSTYGEMLNVPLLLHWPGVVPAGLVVERTTQSIDLMPTLLELSLLETPEAAQGRSLVPLLASPEAPASLGWTPGPAFSERKEIPSEPTGYLRDTDSYAIVADGWKLIQHTRRPDDFPEYELFDHERDPLNLDDVAADHPERVQALASALTAWRERAESQQVAVETEGLSPEEERRLRSLGYIR